MTSLYLIPYGGLGNQLFQISAALALCEDKVTVLSNWGFARENSANKIEIESWVLSSRIEFDRRPKASEFSQRLLNLILRIGARNRSRFLVKTLEVISSQYLSILLGKRLSVTANKGLGFSKLNPKSDSILVGYFQSAHYAKKVIEELLSLRPRRMSNRAEELLSVAQRKKILVVHIRRGDYANEAFGILGDDYYKNAMELLSHEAYEEIWIFSDEMSSAKLITVFSSDKRAIFIDDKGLESSEILEIMRHGNSYIIANSSFSWWAAQLRYDREAHVVCPSPWFKFTDSPTGILDDEWLKVHW